MGRRDWETETFIPTIGCVFDDVAHKLKAEGFDASEDGSGRGTPLVPVAFPANLSGTQCASAENIAPSMGAKNPTAVAVPLQEIGKRTGVSTDDPRAGIGIGQDGDPMFTLQAGAQHGVLAYAFQPRIARNGRGDMGEIVNALNAQSGETGKGDAAPCVAIAGPICRDSFTGGAGGRPEGAAAGHFVPTVYSIMPQNSGKDYKAREVEVAQPIMAGGPVGGNQGGDYIQQHMAVRRLTPVECERLQGFPDGYTMIPWRGKPAEDCPDGPRYKSLGNSMAVPVMAWIGKRIKEALQ